MRNTINAKELRASLPKLVERVRKGARFVVIYRSRPAFQIIPVDDREAPRTALEGDPLYHAPPVGRSCDRRSAAEHDAVLYEP
jgi:prevent-host-death family protein